MVTTSARKAPAVKSHADEYEHRVSRVRDYAKHIADAEATIEKGSLDAAADLLWLYEAKQWMPEAEPPKRKSNRGRPVEPDSQAQFAKWVNDKVHLSTSYTNRLLKAARRVRDYRAQVTVMPPSNERALRPMYEVKALGFPHEKVAEVYNMAAKAAHDAVTYGDTRAAVNRFKADLGTSGVKQLRKQSAAQHLADKIRRELRDLLADPNGKRYVAEFKKLLNDDSPDTKIAAVKS
jgi:hypothetical protein